MSESDDRGVGIDTCRFRESIEEESARKVEVTIGSTFDRIRGEKLRYVSIFFFGFFLPRNLIFVVSRNLLLWLKLQG